MLARNLMSDFANIGSRFYGIGNEYLGLLAATVLLLPFWLAGQARERGWSPRMRRTCWSAGVFLWLLSLGLVGSPGHGADFGGALTLAVAIPIAAALARGRRVRAGHAALMLAALVLAAALVTAADLARPPEARSHLGSLAARVLQEGPGVLATVAQRKLAENLKTALAPYIWGCVLAVTPVLGLWYHRFGRDLSARLDAVPEYRRGLQALGAGAVAALLFNDTGVTAAALAAACAWLYCMDLLLSSRPAPQAEPECA
jgi:hypothetical protein